MIDLDRRPGRFLLLGSASPELIRDSSESLAGRIMYKELSPINVLELDSNLDMKQLLFRGGFPNSLLARSDKSGTRWLESFIQTYIEKDLPLLGMPMQPSETRKMLKMLAHLQGQLLNLATLAKSLGITSPTVKKYIYFLEHAFILRSLEPYTINVGKRVSKSPKLYIRDSGIVNYLLGINSYDDLVSHPDAGNIWEGFVIEQICSLLPYDVDKSFYRTQHGAEIDLIMSYSNGHKIGIEIKFSSSPSLSKGNYEAMKDLQLDKLYVITPTNDRYPMKEKVEVIGLRDMLNLLLSKQSE
jgi:predicted AAA+ superfamily ATPase